MRTYQLSRYAYALGSSVHVAVRPAPTMKKKDREVVCSAKPIECRFKFLAPLVAALINLIIRG